MARKSRPILQLKRVSKTYQMDEVQVEALKETDLAVSPGEYISIKGPSGSGKSTLMHIMGLLDSPTTGEICLDGENVSGFSEAKLAKLRNSHIGFVFQQFNLLKKTTAWQNVALPLIYFGTSRRERKERAVAALERVGLGDRIGNRPNQLSGGQQQRVAIARALINDPDIIFADEPTGNLDTASGKVVMKVFDELNKQGKTVVLVTHEAVVAKHAKRRITIVDGVVNPPSRKAATRQEDK